MSFTLLKDRPIRSGLTALSVLLLGAAAVLPWWKTIDAQEPGFVKLCHVAMLLPAVMVGMWTIRPYRRIRWSLAAAVVALCLPLLLMVYLTTVDAHSISTAVEQTSQADRLIRSLEETDTNPQVPWIEQRTLFVTPTISNDYTLIDGMEAVSYFIKPGWWLCLVAGTILLVTIWADDAPTVRRTAREWYPWALLTVGLIALRCFGPLAVASLHLSRARQAAAQGEYATARNEYQAAARWDKRLEDSISFHTECGRVSARDGEADPDRWAMLADLYVTAGAADRAYGVYELHLLSVADNGALRLRWSHLLLYRGAAAYNAGRFQSAIALWEEAIRLDPCNVETMYALGMGCTKVQDYPAAIFWWKRLAFANESVGMFKNDLVASVVYRKMITARAFSGLAWCYYRIGLSDLALHYDAASKQEIKVVLEESR